MAEEKKQHISGANSSGIKKLRFTSWIKQNFFSNILNSTLTVLAVCLLYSALIPFLDWAIFNADFTGATGKECTASGACWAWLDQRINQFLYGFYPSEEYWRVNLTIFLLIMQYQFMVVWIPQRVIIVQVQLLMMEVVFCHLL